MVLFILSTILPIQGAYLSDNTCYQCLKNQNRYCYLDSETRKCCTQNDTDIICLQGQCSLPYQGPENSDSTQSYNSTHPKSSKYDYYLNLFNCQQWQNNPCEQLTELIIPSIGYHRTFKVDGENSDYCFYNNTMKKTQTQSLNFQVKFTNFTEDYALYVWYSSSSNEGLKNVVGEFQLNRSSTNKQDGFSLANNMTLYNVLIRNATIKSFEQIVTSHASLQLMLMDATIYSSLDDTSDSQQAPVLVIVIAVLVGGFISIFCIAVVVYMIIKSIKQSRKKAEEENQMPEQEQLNSASMSKNRLNELDKLSNNTRFQNNIDIESLDQQLEQQTVKVLPQRTISLKKQKTQKQSEMEVQDEIVKKKTQTDNIEDYILADMQKKKTMKVKRQNTNHTQATLTNDQSTIKSTITSSYPQIKKQLKSSKDYQNDEYREEQNSTELRPNNIDSQRGRLPSIRQKHIGLFDDTQIKEENENQEQDEDCEFNPHNHYDNVELNNYLDAFHNKYTPEDSRQTQAYIQQTPDEVQNVDEQSAVENLMQPKVNPYIVEELQVEQVQPQQEIEIDTNIRISKKLKKTKKTKKKKENKQQEDERQKVQNMFYEEKIKDDGNESNDYGYESIEHAGTTKITEPEKCKECVDNTWRLYKFYCTQYFTTSQTVLDSAANIGYCCDGNPLTDSPTLCNTNKMTCSSEFEDSKAQHFKYGLCPNSDFCGNRDIYVYDYINSFESGYLSSKFTCMYRFLAVTLDTSVDKQMKIRVTEAYKVSLYATILTNTKSSELYDDFGYEWKIFESNGVYEGNYDTGTAYNSTIVINITNYLYIMAIPEDEGSYLEFEYYLTTDILPKPSTITVNTTNSTNSTEEEDSSSTSTSSTSSSSAEDVTGYFNNYTRKLLSYALAGLFGLVFLIGIFNIYRIFFSKEAKLRKLYEEEIRLKRKEDIERKIRRELERRWLEYYLWKVARGEAQNDNAMGFQLDLSKIKKEYNLRKQKTNTQDTSQINQNTLEENKMEEEYKQQSSQIFNTNSFNDSLKHNTTSFITQDNLIKKKYKDKGKGNDDQVYGDNNKKPSKKKTVRDKQYDSMNDNSSNSNSNNGNNNYEVDTNLSKHSSTPSNNNQPQSLIDEYTYKQSSQPPQHIDVDFESIQINQHLKGNKRKKQQKKAAENNQADHLQNLNNMELYRLPVFEGYAPQDNWKQEEDNKVQEEEDGFNEFDINNIRRKKLGDLQPVKDEESYKIL